MKFQGMEDRLNPIAPAGVDDTTLGGYAAVHGRAPGFEGVDGRAYTVAIETERSEGGGAGEEAWAAYIVFLRWADQGSAIMGHLETNDLAFGRTSEEARAGIEALPLTRIKQVLDESIQRKRSWQSDADQEEDGGGEGN